MSVRAAGSIPVTGQQTAAVLLLVARVRPPRALPNATPCAAAGIVLHLVETGAGICLGAGSTLTFLGLSHARRSAGVVHRAPVVRGIPLPARAA